jgi:hypothetical protein
MVPKDRNINKPKRYIAIVKISNRPDGKAYCVKYRFDNLIKFSKFLDDKWTGWKWFNVYSNRGKNKGVQLGSFTSKNKPLKRYL